MGTNTKGGNAIGQAGAYALNKTYTTGTLTYAMLTARRANLEEARLKKGDARHTSSHPVSSWGRSTPAIRGAAAADRGLKETYLNRGKTHVLGDRWVHYEENASIRQPTINGRNKKFKAEISAGKYLGRTAWAKARHTSGFHKELKPRKHRFKHQTHWRRKGHSIIAR